jgi:uncharacterized protein (DUF58 family)
MLTANGWVVAIGSVVLLVAGWALDYPELVVVGLGLLVAFLAAIGFLRMRPELDSRRAVRPARVTEGDPASGTVTVVNRGTRRTPPLVAQELFGGAALVVELPSLRPAGTHSTTYVLPTARRGHVAVGPLTIGFADPFRLVGMAQARGGHATLIVHPRVHTVSPLPTGRLRELDGAINSSARKGGIAFHSLREYVPGDDLRLIHWRSSAKTGALLVRHNVVTNQPRLMVVLDTWAGSYPGDAFEDAVRVAASMVCAGIDAHYPTELLTTSGLTHAADPTGRGRTAILDLLASLDPTDDDPGLNGIVRQVDQVRGASLGVVTGQPPPERVRGVARVRSRFEAVTVVQVGERLGRPGMAVAGALVMACRDSDEFVRIWKQRIG